MDKGRDWSREQAAHARARLMELGALNTADDSMRAGRTIAAMRGLASAIGQMRAVDDFDPEGLSSQLLILADEFERVEQRFYLDKLGKLAA